MVIAGKAQLIFNPKKLVSMRVVKKLVGRSIITSDDLSL